MGTDDMTHVYTGVGHDGSTLHIVYTGWSHHDSPTLVSYWADLAAVNSP